MHYLIGTDEAGYGPNLGPLLISASVWALPEPQVSGDSSAVGGSAPANTDLYSLLGDVVAAAPPRRGSNNKSQVAIADSKKLYKPGGGWKHLERGLWAAMAALGRHPSDWLDVWKALSPDSCNAMASVPWYQQNMQRPLPKDVDAEEISRLIEVFVEGLARAGVQLIDLRSRAVFAGQFNARLNEHVSKGALLSHETLELVAEVVRPLGEGTIHVVCDKHGGRNRYADLLADHFPERLIEIYGEGCLQSVYRFGPPERRVEICFQAKGEGFLPAALASMASKYLRELAMEALNDFWCQRVEGLRPTAGYPADALRFHQAIAKAQAEAGVPDEMLWRRK